MLKAQMEEADASNQQLVQDIENKQKDAKKYQQMEKEFNKLKNSYMELMQNVLRSLSRSRSSVSVESLATSLDFTLILRFDLCPCSPL